MSETSVLKDLMQTLEDGQKGFEAGAAKLENDGSPGIAHAFREFGAQRATFAAELQECARADGEEIAEHGSVAGTVHRGWMTLKDALAGDDPNGVLDAAEQGEDYATGEYDKALQSDELSPSTRTIVARQRDQVRAVHDQVRAMRDEASV